VEALDDVDDAHADAGARRARHMGLAATRDPAVPRRRGCLSMQSEPTTHRLVASS
jgi:hypothetical protein